MFTPQPGISAQNPKSANSFVVESWILVATILLSGMVAWMRIWSESIWYDEPITLLVTAGHRLNPTLNGPLSTLLFKPTTNMAVIVWQLYQRDVHPPLYFCALAVWRVLLGPSLEVARTFSALFTLGTVWLLYRYAVEAAMRWPSVPAIIYALSFAGLRHAYNARPYAMAIFLIVLTLFLSHRKSKWTGVCAAACVATHYFAALCVGPIVFIDCVTRWKSDRRWSVLTALSFLICCAPLFLLVTKHFGARPAQFAGFGAFSSEVWALLVGSLRAAVPPCRLGCRPTFLVGAIFALGGGIWAARHKQLTIPISFVAFLCGFLLIAIASHKSIVQMPKEYYLGISAPLLALLFAYGVNAFPMASPLLAIALLSGTIAPGPLTPTGEWRGILNRIRPNCNRCAILVGAGMGPAVPGCVLYEAGGPDVYVLRANDDPRETVDRIGSNRTIFLIPSNEPQTAEIERRVVETFSAVKGDGYFTIQPGRESGQ